MTIRLPLAVVVAVVVIIESVVELRGESNAIDVDAVGPLLQATSKSRDQHHGELWAVLVAGSNSWMNYRHQADVCHAYQILHKHGVPDDHIIVMMYDDLANNVDNPTPGVVINRPGGPDVYAGVPKDYSGKDVTPENFLKVLQGDAKGMRGTGSGRVLQSGPNDRVFINMVDHGAPGIFAFPDEYLNATDFANTLIGMHRDKRFHEMVVYVEACESGSLFENLLPKDIEVYALSASSPRQHSYACYFDNKLGTYLGDVFSVKWMEDSDIENLRRESLKSQFVLVREEVTTSTVMHWGELSIGSRKMARFLGGKKSSHPHSRPTTQHLQFPADPCVNSSVPSPDVPLAILQAKKHSATTPEEREHLQEQLDILHEKRRALKLAMHELAREVTGDTEVAANMVSGRHQLHDIIRWPCYMDAVRIFHTRCINLAQNPYALRLVDTFINLCEHGYTADQVLRATTSVCPFSPKNVL
ncbi:legumain-like [Eriocheir sinensis]|uniref:legumain-like n=1 Tax=Eriocheir sinensis TaxID=95602 RepID=UPI0021C75DDF|nr:legumain-like [Eriocheir sinensis]XP_050686870.1 legumain-like [Eriocheir sinensis]